MAPCGRSGGYALAMCRKTSSKYMYLKEQWWAALDLCFTSDPLSDLPNRACTAPGHCTRKPEKPAVNAVRACTWRRLIYGSRSAAQFQRDAGRVPGFDPAAAQAIKAAAAQASKSKAAKKNEKRKEKKQSVSAVSAAEDCDRQSAPEAALQRLNLGTSTADGVAQPVREDDTRAALEKQIRALRKKVSAAMPPMLLLLRKCAQTCPATSAGIEVLTMCAVCQVRQSHTLEDEQRAGSTLSSQEQQKLANLTAWQAELAEVERQVSEA